MPRAKLLSSATLQPYRYAMTTASIDSGEYLIRKLRAFAPLSEQARHALRSFGGHSLRSLAPHQDLISEGDHPRDVNLVVEGWACRYKMLDDGRRQIMAIFLPGDLFDLNVYILKEMDHSIAALTPLKVARISESEMDQLCDSHPRILRALWWDTLVSAAIQREWTVTLGQRDAMEALAHLCCELFLRQRVVGLTHGQICQLPMTQADLADALGLTPTHVGRVQRALNAGGLARIERRKLTIIDLPGLMALAAFNPNYLHLRDPVPLSE